MSGWLRLMPLGLMLMPLAACTTIRSTGTIVVDTTCSAMKPITYSAANDTAETVKEIRQHNAAYTALCP